LVGGCSSAKKANEVTAAYVPMHRYSSMTCQQLFYEAEALRRTTPSLEASVDSHRSQQNGVEFVTWFLFWPAAFALDKGERQSNDLAQARGEIQAIQQALISNNCNSPSASRSLSSNQPSTASGSNIESKIIYLKNLHEKGLLTKNQFNEQVKLLLNSKP
jgi:hypothetical protein